MRLIVRQNGEGIRELQFNAGPIHIGRGTDSQVFLPDKKVSRQHAVIFSTPEGKWVLQDLDSANKTYLNDKAIHKAGIATGDLIRIAGFTIEIDIELDAESEQPTRLEDTLATAPRKLQVIKRSLDSDYGPDIKFPASRARDFLEATEDICKAHSLEQVLNTVVKIMFGQFNAYHAWCALRNEPEGPMISHTGKARDGRVVGLNDIMLNEQVTYAVDHSLFLLFPSVPDKSQGEALQSAIVAPVVDPDGCFGVLYIDNTNTEAAYNMADLDYLMLLAIHTAAIVENF